MPKSKKINKNIEEEAEEVVEEIYEEENTAQTRDFEKPVNLISFTLKYSILSAVIGVLAGVAGVLWVVSGGLSVIDSSLGSFYIGSGLTKVERVKQVTVSLEEQVADVVDSVSPSIVSFVRVQGGVEDGEESTLAWPPAVLGRGIIVTNDGWLLTAPKVFDTAELDTIRVLTADGSLHKILSVSEDWLEPLVYVQIDANDLLPVNLGARDQVKPGQVAIIVNPGLSRYSSEVHLNRVERVKWFAASNLAQAVFSSEVFPTRVRMEDIWDKDQLGSAVFDLSGNMIGMVTEDDMRSSLPVDVISHANRSFFGQNQVVRAWLGVQYVDLSLVGGLPESLTYGFNKGALIYGGDKEAVDENSPAEVAGLKANDIILEVEGEVINGRYNLTELIQSYSPGKEVKLLILREGKRLEVSVRLGEFK